MLIKCPKCGRDVSDKAEKCPGCDYVLANAFEDIVVCEECGARIEGHPSTCPNCGNPLLATRADVLPEDNNPHKTESSRQKLFIVGAIAIVAIIAILFGLSGLNSDEKQALADCQALKSTLLSPSSMELYEVLVRHDEEDGDITYISFGAANSYNAIIQKVALYQNGQFIGYEGENTSDAFLLKDLPYFLYVMNGSTAEVAKANDMVIINVKKLMNKLK